MKENKTKNEINDELLDAFKEQHGIVRDSYYLSDRCFNIEASSGSFSNTSSSR